MLRKILSISYWKKVPRNRKTPRKGAIEKRPVKERFRFDLTRRISY